MKKRHFKLGFEFHLMPERMEEFEALLMKANLNDSSLMRLDYKERYPGFNEYPYDTLISFQHAKHATWFKLVWVPCMPYEKTVFGKVILPIIRRVMPRVIAQDILGISPMQAPHSSIYTMRAKYAASQPAPPTFGLPKSLAEDKD